MGDACCWVITCCLPGQLFPVQVNWKLWPLSLGKGQDRGGEWGVVSPLGPFPCFSGGMWKRARAGLGSPHSLWPPCPPCWFGQGQSAPIAPAVDVSEAPPPTHTPSLPAARWGKGSWLETSPSAWLPGWGWLGGSPGFLAPHSPPLPCSHQPGAGGGATAPAGCPTALAASSSSSFRREKAFA